MGEERDSSLAFERLLKPAAARPALPPEESSEHRLDVVVLFTSASSTVSALRKAGSLASQLSARIKLVVPQVVPYPLPMESPPVLLDFSERRFREIASESPVETTVQIYLCRDRLETLKQVLAPGSLIVIGARKRWWPTREKSLARGLRHAGHEVIITEMR